MYWKITFESEKASPDVERSDGRFVLHRHTDTGGAHLDLRLEEEACLVGWRIDGSDIGGERWATEKAPHPLWWLDRDGEAVRVDAGTYAWLERGEGRGRLMLKGQNGTQVLSVEREAELPLNVVCEIRSVLKQQNASIEEAGRLIADGITARRRAVERLCGLGRELDGTAFGDSAWRRMLGSLSLDEIQAQLRSFEVRFDQKYPPLPVSRPESLEEARAGERSEAAMAIVNESTQNAWF